MSLNFNLTCVSEKEYKPDSPGREALSRLPFAEFDARLLRKGGRQRRLSLGGKYFRGGTHKPWPTNFPPSNTSCSSCWKIGRSIRCWVFFTRTQAINRRSATR